MVERPDVHRGGRRCYIKGYLYILETKGNHYYIGSTNNIDRRLMEHNFGKTISLRKLLKIKLVLKQEYNDLKTARKIEAKLKKFKNKKIIERIIKDGKIITGP